MKNLRILVAAAAVVAGTAAPALASDSPGDMAKNTAMFPVTLAGVGTAMVVGTPIAVVRQCSVRIREYTASMADNIGGKEHFPPNFFASFMSVPFGTLVGTAEGVYYGPKNAVSKGWEKPFCVDSFSLGDMD